VEVDNGRVMEDASTKASGGGDPASQMSSEVGTEAADESLDGPYKGRGRVCGKDGGSTGEEKCETLRPTDKVRSKTERRAEASKTNSRPGNRTLLSSVPYTPFNGEGKCRKTVLNDKLAY
jgi:hypothetical protein